MPHAPHPAALHRRTLNLHGQKLAYTEAGQGPTLLLVHGIAEAAWAWEAVIPKLARNHRVVAPDLLGHGRSAKPRGDYSLGNQATLLRDLMIALDIGSATLVGHSLGGGIAMQFAYQYPERCERLVLIASGGLGQEVSFLLRSLGLPGADVVAPLVLSTRARGWADSAAGWLGNRGLRASIGQRALWRSFGTLTDPATRAAFIATVHAVIDQRGQRVSALERLYLAQAMPTLLVWGKGDRIIPAKHAEAAHAAMPGSHLEVIDGAGHFVQLEKPELVASLILDFLGSTQPAHLDTASIRDALLTGGRRRRAS